ncbi:MAG: lytic transglycosylase domain-containing protein [Deltaproteobacteria bacterium]|nr:lytic transglycosylase domain-containing protein [Deltaproteobacteria bacterium]
MINIFFLGAVAVFLLSGAASADFYRYVDEDGVVHITNVPTTTKYKWMMSERKPKASNSTESASYKKTTYSSSSKIPTNSKYEDIIYNAAERYGIDPKLVKAIVKAESDFDSSAVSIAGARGLMQLMPETARIMGVRDIHDPEENVEGGIRYLSKLLKMFDWKIPLAVAAYNAGENAVLKYGTIPPYSETQTYVKRVLYYYGKYKNTGA